MEDSTFGSSPGENPIAQNQLNSFSFAFDSAIELVEGFKDAQRGSRRQFVFCPLVALRLPDVKGGYAIRIFLESSKNGFAPAKAAAVRKNGKLGGRPRKKIAQ